MSITTVTIYETDDGKQHKSFDEAVAWENLKLAQKAIEDGSTFPSSCIENALDVLEEIDLSPERFKSTALAAYFKRLWKQCRVGASDDD